MPFTEIVELYAGTALTTAAKRIIHDMKIEHLLEEGRDEEAMKESNNYRNSIQKGEIVDPAFFTLREVAFMSDDELSSLSWPHAILLMSLVRDEAASLLQWKLAWCRAAAWRGIPDTWSDFHSYYHNWVLGRNERFLKARLRSFNVL
jgi:hypothetical protein